MMILKTSRGALSSGGFDAMAARYLKAVEIAGATVTSTQRTALNTFFKTGKSQGWMSRLRRVYLPIWAAMAPNAIDMLTVASGTFGGTITHSPGYATGNGSTGYFEYDTTATAQGLSASSGQLFWLGVIGGTTGVQLGGFNGSGTGTRAVLSATASAITSQQTTFATTEIIAGSTNANLGIVLSTRTSTTSHKVFHRRSTFSQRGTTNTTAETSASSGVNQAAWARGQGASRTNFSNAGLGAHGFGLGMTDVQAENFTLALKTLWETSTGLTLP